MPKSTALFVTDGELAERMGLTTDQLATAMPALMQQGFPMPDELFGKRRYWPACEAWLDRRYGLCAPDLHGPYAPDEPEPWRKG